MSGLSGVWIQENIEVYLKLMQIELYKGNFKIYN